MFRAVFEESEPGPHPGGPLRPAGGVAGRSLNIPDVPGKDMEPSYPRSRFAPADSLRFCDIIRYIGSIQRSTFSTCSAEVAKLRKQFRA